ncbi:MAG: hypothetical protein AAFQ94_30335 [Bacteroidota bacterium]
MLGTSFPGPGQKVNDNNLKLLRGDSAFSWRKNNGFINAPKLKSEMTLDLLKQLNQIKKHKSIQETRTRKLVIAGVFIGIILSAILISVF